MLIPNPVAASGSARPDHPAVVAPDGTRTYGELATIAARRAASVVGPWVELGAHRDLRFVEDLHAVGWAGAAARVRAEGPRLADGGTPVPASRWALDEARLEIHTSGTTGAPKAVRLDTHQLLFAALGSAIRLGHLPGDRWLDCLPLHHVGGLAILFRCAWYGTTVELHPRFDADAVNAAIDGGCTQLSLVPAMLERVLDARADRPFPSHLRFILIGGAPMPQRLIDRCRRIDAPVALSWGMSETASQVATRFAGDLTARSAPPLPFATVSSDGPRLVVDGPQVRAPLTTSDLGAVLDGEVHVYGRADDVFITGGENVAPAEIEAVLARHPDVREVAVRGVPDDTWGERPVAWLVADGVDDAELDAFCRNHLPAYKVPDRYVRLDALPRNALGKIRRAELTEAGTDIEG